MKILDIQSRWWLVSAAGVVLSAVSVIAADAPQQAAARADAILRSEVPYANAAKLAPARIDDERYFAIIRQTLCFIKKPLIDDAVSIVG